MLHDEESPEKPQYNMASPPSFLGKLPILPNPLVSSKKFQTRPPFPSILKKSTPPFLIYEGDGGGGGGGGGPNYVFLTSSFTIIMETFSSILQSIFPIPTGCKRLFLSRGTRLLTVYVSSDVVLF